MRPSIKLTVLLKLRGYRRLVLLATLTSLAAFASGSVAGAQDGNVRVMTRNIYVGTLFEELLHATSPREFAAAATATFQNIQATNVEERAKAVASEI